ncbi:MAG: type II secretion system F family protein [Clostridiales bacterium]|nr:type II secretion system F family protein [Clostridiales bacterium]
MKKFNYRAMTKDGKKTEGIYEGNSREEVISLIAANGYYPLKIEEVKVKPHIELNFTNRVKTKDIAVFCRQFYTMLDAGVSITNSLSMLRDQILNKTLKRVLGEIDEDVKKGEMLSESMSKFPDVFPQLLISMVQSGEATGNIDEMMLRMSVHYEKENKTNNKVKSAMIYPIVLAIVAIVAVMGIMIFVMPTFKELFDTEGIELPFITKALLALSDFLSSYALLILVIIIGLIVGFNYYKKTENGMKEVSKLKLKLPIIRGVTRKIIVARFSRTLSMLLSSGISLIEAMPIVCAVLGNKVAEEELTKVRERVIRGDGLSTPLSETTVFTDMLNSMVKIGEESGSLDAILDKTADFYDEEVDQAIMAATSMIEPALIIVMGVAIGIIVISIMLPMFEMYTQL